MESIGRDDERKSVGADGFEPLCVLTCAGGESGSSKPGVVGVLAVVISAPAPPLSPPPLSLWLSRA